VGCDSPASLWLEDNVSRERHNAVSIPDEEEIVLEGDEPEPEMEETGLPELPPELSHIILTAFPPGNKLASGFTASLVDLMTKADNYNLARLFEVFPVFGVAYMCWDERLIEVSPNRDRVTWTEQFANLASIMDIPSWLERCRILQSTINYSRTQHMGETISARDLAKATPYGAY
jgi:hypothetical protein